MMPLCSEVLKALWGRTFATAESLTGGGIGAELTCVPGASAVFKGGIISYCDEAKANLLGVDPALLRTFGAVSAPVAESMALGARKALRSNIAISVTGLAGPDGDEFGHSVGTVFIGYASEKERFAREYHFPGNRQEVRQQTIHAALKLILEREELL